MEYPAIYHRRQISPLAPLGRDDRAVMGPSDIKMAKNMMDGPVLGCFTAVFGTVRHKFAPKVVGRCLEAMGWTVRV